MEEYRDRARANLPTVLLTLLSIVQAFSLELIWTYVNETPALFSVSAENTMMWAQIAITLASIILIWIVYAGPAMRFRWVPTTTDSVYPFVIGILEFVMISLLGPQTFGYWMLSIAAIFALMIWISHRSMKRARKDGSNERFFSVSEPAILKDFYPAIAMIAACAAIGIYLTIVAPSNGLLALALLVIATIIIFQFVAAATFWERSLSDDWTTKTD